MLVMRGTQASYLRKSGLISASQPSFRKHLPELSHKLQMITDATDSEQAYSAPSHELWPTLQSTSSTTAAYRKVREPAAGTRQPWAGRNDASTEPGRAKYGALSPLTKAVGVREQLARNCGLGRTLLSITRRRAASSRLAGSCGAGSVIEVIHHGRLP